MLNAREKIKSRFVPLKPEIRGFLSGAMFMLSLVSLIDTIGKFIFPIDLKLRSNHLFEIAVDAMIVLFVLMLFAKRGRWAWLPLAIMFLTGLIELIVLPFSSPSVNGLFLVLLLFYFLFAVGLWWWYRPTTV